MANELIEQLEKQTIHHSSPHLMLKTSAAEEIRKQGRGAVPMLLKALAEGVAVMAAMTLLAEIVEYSPVRATDRGDVSKMIESWLEWGDDQGYR